MEIFEIHITGNDKIIDAAKLLNLKTIVIDLLKPDKTYLRSEYMTSHVYRCPNYKSCKVFVDAVVNKLEFTGVDIKRIKIECPYYLHYKDASLYFEVHFNSESGQYPLSRNQNKTECLATAREYDQSKYTNLLDKNWENPTLELCLYDTNVNEDLDWFRLYENT